jgi:hypothetical protein
MLCNVLGKFVSIFIQNMLCNVLGKFVLIFIQNMLCNVLVEVPLQVLAKDAFDNAWNELTKFRPFLQPWSS